MLIEVQYFKMHFHFQIRMTTSKSNNCGWIESVFNFKATIEVKEFVGTPLPLCNVGVQLACASSSFFSTLCDRNGGGAGGKCPSVQFPLPTSNEYIN